MATVYRVKVIRKRAERHERKRMQNYKVQAERLSAFEELLNEIYTVCRPKPRDYEVRRDLISAFNEIAKDIYGYSGNAPVVEEFGSFVMDLFHSKSDLDLSVNFDNNSAQFSHEKRIQTLRKFARKLYALQKHGHVSGVHPITAAKVPVLKVVDCGTKVECDISVENRDGVSKSKIIHMICSLDERFQKLSFLMKTWAKAQNINSSKDKTLNSLSIILLVAFHLQTRNPPILPPFSAVLEDGSDPDVVAKSLKKFVNYGKGNKESVAELLVTLLIKLLSVEKLWAKGLCASTYEASWLSKTWDSKVCCIGVEDFIDRSQNVARAVGKGEVKRIYKCIQRTSEYISLFMDGLVEIPKLKSQLFGNAAPFQDVFETRNMKEDGNIITLPCTDIKNKKDQSKEGQNGSQWAIPSEPVAKSTEGWEGLASVNGGQSKGKWSTEGWEEVRSASWGQAKEDREPADSPWSKGKWSTEGWEGIHSASWGQPKEDGGPADSRLSKGKWSTEGWEGIHSASWGQPNEDGGPADSRLSKGKWSTEGWEGIHSASWGQPKEDGGPADSRLSKGKWSTEGWEGIHSASWGQPKEDGGPADSRLSKGKWFTEGWEGIHSASWGQPKEDGGPADSRLSKGKWFTEGWEGIHSASWGQPKEDGGPADSRLSKGKWSTEGWEGIHSASWGQPKEDGGPADSRLSKGKWSTEGWEGIRSASWGQPKEDDGSPWSKGKWSTKGWGNTSSANWGQSNGDNAPPVSILTKRKRSEETPRRTSSAQWLGKSDTKSWPNRKHSSKYAPNAKWSKMQRGGQGGS